MKHEAILAGDEWPSRDPRVAVDFDVRVRTESGDIEAQILNLSSDGFRLHSADPLQVGWEVTLEAAKQFPVKALICWACGNDAGGVFAEPVALKTFSAAAISASRFRLRASWLMPLRYCGGTAISR